MFANFASYSYNVASVGIRALSYFSAMVCRGAHGKRHATIGEVYEHDEVACEAQLDARL